MAGITNNGTVNNISQGQKPSDYSDPSVTTSGAWLCKYRTDLELTILKATVDESDPATSLTAIIANGSIGITKQALDLVTVDFDLSARTVVMYTDFKQLRTNMSPVGAGDDLLTDAVTNYIATVDIYVRTSAP